MRANWVGACAMALLLPAVGRADTVQVGNYSWLQLPPADVTAIVGGGVGGGSGYGTPGAFRWGDRTWIPDGTLTSNGASMYWAGLQFDQARRMTNVWVQWWASEGTSISNYFIDGSADGTSWTNIGQRDNGLYKTGEFLDTNPVTNGLYRYVRVRLEPGGYTYGNAGRGGPGFTTIEPYGYGAVDVAQVNWANKANFGTAVAINGLDFTGLGYHEGTLIDRGSPRTGDTGNWEAGDYAQIDLGTKRRIQGAAVAWEYQWRATSFVIRCSNDGVNFIPTTLLSGSTIYSGSDAPSVGITFAPVYARYVRMTDVLTPNAHAIMNTLLIHGAPPAGSLVLMK
jgi:hypothetical protein